MTSLRLRILFVSLTGLFAAGCSLWDPDHETPPDDRLRAILDQLDGQERLEPLQRERPRFELDRLATRHPDHVPSQVAAAAMVLDAGERVRAQGFLDRVLDLEPDNADARAMRVRVAVADGSLDLARKIVDDGLRLRPDAATLFESSAWLHQLEGRPEDAIEALGVARRLGAPAWRVAFHIGVVEEGRGNFLAAEDSYESAISERDGEFEDAQRRLRGLRAKRGAQ